VGEAVRRWPRAFEEARRRLADRLVRFGYIPDRKDYEEQVRRSDVVVSTAVHESFGLPVIEAVAAGCFPLLPARLSYPEIVPADLHETFLYRDERELRVKLGRVLKGKAPWDRLARLADHVQRYDWGNQIRLFDEALERAAHV
jgi:glycosyltransferase involved in cell wall biosynthesis